MCSWIITANVNMVEIELINVENDLCMKSFLRIYQGNFDLKFLREKAIQREILEYKFQEGKTNFCKT